MTELGVVTAGEPVPGVGCSDAVNERLNIRPVVECVRAVLVAPVTPRAVVDFGVLELVVLKQH